jgi:hypothetical protein
MLPFYQFPKDHWVHLRTSNPIESPFAALRLRTDAAKRFKRVENATAVIWKMLLVAQQRFRRLNAPELMNADLPRRSIRQRTARPGTSLGGCRLTSFCTPLDMTSLQQVGFIIGRSEDVFPRLDHLYLDMVLIDGGHGFAIPFIDWFYTSRLVKLGGLMIVDDTWIKAGRILSEFMAVDPHWRLLREFDHTSIFEKISHVG